jgi:DNA-binding NarL/FixJ family response regulator
MLAHEDFDVVGVATDGIEALEKARQLDPDVIVLDVEMPHLDGFQTLRALALRQEGSPPTPTVFVSMHDADDVIDAAFQCGGRGYVVKVHAARDLAIALDHVLHGGMFVPTLTSLFRLAEGGGHAMQLHRGLDPFLDDVGLFLDLALRQGDVACVIATEPVRHALAARLRTRGWEAGGPAGHERILVVDANDALNRFMRNGRPDADRLAEIAAEVDGYRAAVAEGPAQRLTIFGDMVVPLVANGNPEAAVAVENLWDTLTRDLPFFTLCGYPTSCFHQGASTLWPDACAVHAFLSHANGA